MREFLSEDKEFMKVRSATSDDVSLIFSFIQKKAEFDRNIGAFSGILQVSENKIRKILFGKIPFSYVLFAESAGFEIGFALYGFRCSSFVGQPSIWLDDLYVDEAQRGQGAGAVLMAQLAKIAQENDCTHLAWNADARNIRGLRFYRRLGAEMTEQHGNRCFLRWIPGAATD
jgi:GNAT superfamily N-acetyltransferase